MLFSWEDQSPSGAEQTDQYAYRQVVRVFKSARAMTLMITCSIVNVHDQWPVQLAVCCSLSRSQTEGVRDDDSSMQEKHQHRHEAA
jgi:hypothetical protein